MKKHLFALLASLALLVSIPSSGLAQDSQPPQDVAVKIVSPDKVQAYPGQETTVEATVTNQSNHDINNLMAYITMANLSKHWTVNLEDFSADKPVSVGALKPNESKNVSLPIRFVYTDNYHLYVTALSDDQLAVSSSQGIPIEILGNTKMDAGLVQIVSIVVPALLLVLLVIRIITQRKRARQQGDSLNNL